jgi:hypothetical protein
MGFAREVGKQMVKSAATTSEVAGEYLSPLMWGAAGPVSNQVGKGIAALTDPYTQEDVEGLYDRDVSNILLPGVAGYRNAKRLARTSRATHGDLSPYLSEEAGKLTSALGPAAIGALLGGAIDGDSGMAGGALLGGGAGLLANYVGAPIAAALTDPSDEEDFKSESVLKNLLLPGVGAYNQHKRLGLSQRKHDIPGRERSLENDKRRAGEMAKLKAEALAAGA